MPRQWVLIPRTLQLLPVVVVAVLQLLPVVVAVAVLHLLLLASLLTSSTTASAG